MKYFIWLGAVAICVVCTLLGLTIGINLNPESTTRYVLTWGSLGDWVAGVGTFTAVAVALWQSYILRKEDVEDLIIDQRQVRQRWVISVISRGKRPARVLGIAFRSRRTGFILPIKRFIFDGDNASLPQTLNYAENLDFVTRTDMFENLAINAVLAFDEDLEDLEIHVKTTLGSFNKAVIGETKSAFREALVGSEAMARIVAARNT